MTRARAENRHRESPMNTIVSRNLDGGFQLHLDLAGVKLPYVCHRDIR